ncbi:MAG TPA: c-type cytochrome [Burkholderiales bacterium]|nr:c-type cytochrome [Burkholderiales bacterium]
MLRRAWPVAMALALAGCEQAAPGFDDPRADPGDAARVALGERVYAQHCAACHGPKLEGQPDWRKRLANGRLPAPPHDETGHTWHHADRVLFGITRNGLVPPNAPAGYQSDMPAFAGKLSDDEIWAVLAYIKSRWSAPEVREARAQMSASAKP